MILLLALALAAPPTLLREKLFPPRPGKPVVQLHLAAPPDPNTCEALRRATAKLQEFGLSGEVHTAADSCSTAWRKQPPTNLATKLGANQTNFAAVIADAQGIVRYHRVFPQTPQGAAALEADLILWQQGQASFVGNCGHCHGEDGAGTFFQGIKTMSGITTRLSDEKILEGGESFGAVPISSWSKQEVDALLLFIRGL
jgi:mono/diheme cytochrome c family protein